MSDSSLSSISDGSDVLRLLWGCPAPTTHRAQRYPLRRNPAARSSIPPLLHPAQSTLPARPPRRGRGAHHHCRRYAAAVTWQGVVERSSREERWGAVRSSGKHWAETPARADQARCFSARGRGVSGAGTASPPTSLRNTSPSGAGTKKGEEEAEANGRFPAERRRWCRARRRRPGRARRGAAPRGPRRAGSSARPPAGRWVGAGAGRGAGAGSAVTSVTRTLAVRSRPFPCSSKPRRCRARRGVPAAERACGGGAAGRHSRSCPASTGTWLCTTPGTWGGRRGSARGRRRPRAAPRAARPGRAGTPAAAPRSPGRSRTQATSARRNWPGKGAPRRSGAPGVLGCSRRLPVVLLMRFSQATLLRYRRSLPQYSSGSSDSLSIVYNKALDALQFLMVDRTIRAILSCIVKAGLYGCYITAWICKEGLQHRRAEQQDMLCTGSFLLFVQVPEGLI